MSRTTILHVEDDPNDQVLFEHACRKAGHSVEVQVVEDGDNAIAYLSGSGRYADRERQPLPQLVLLDLKLPRLGGLEVLHWMRHNERFRYLPVVVLSSSNHEVDVKRSYDAGANSFLVKPAGFEALVGLVKKMFDYWLGLNERPQ